MIDVNLPIELDDGRPANIISVDRHMINVSFRGTPVRGGPSYDGFVTYWFDNPTGIFSGERDGSRYHTIRNVEKPESFIPEDWS